MQATMPEELAPATTHATADAEQQQQRRQASLGKRKPGAQPMVGDPKDMRSPQDLFEAWYLKSGASAHGLKPSAKMARRAWHKMLPPRAAAMATKWCRSYWDRQCAANLAARHGQTYVAADRVRKTDDGKCVSLADLVRQISGSDRGERGREIVARVIAALESAGWCFARKRAESSRRERVVDLDMLAPLISALAITLSNEPERASVAAYWGSTAHAMLLLGRQENTPGDDADHATSVQTPYGLDMQFAVVPAVVAPTPATMVPATEPATSHAVPATSVLQHVRPPLPTIMPYDLRPPVRGTAHTTTTTPWHVATPTDGPSRHGFAQAASPDVADNAGHGEFLCPTHGSRSTVPLYPRTAQEQTQTSSSGGNNNNSDNPIWLDDDDDDDDNAIDAFFGEGTTGADELDLNNPPPLRDDSDVVKEDNGRVKIEVKDETNEPKNSTKRKWTSRGDAEDEGTETEDEDEAWTGGQSGPESPIEVDYPPTRPTDLLGLCLKRRRTTTSRANRANGTDNETQANSNIIEDDNEDQWRVWHNVRV
ncbi:hypothetical protein psal_cds_25 [Pandoravirus salinus]|uniref:Uncharacterized protein n=1 Tax=Pandoravirus salinus TaxID=1349410 RepID=S4VZC6_9VIRU|nr:DNA pol3 delta2 superfamily incomplete domain [Pandoravirus salinus]AGO83392.1 hypothetical protein psal_cds_25 [Pandoravirus salinus]